MKPSEYDVTFKTYGMLWDELYEFVKARSIMHEHDSLTNLTEACAYDQVKQKMEEMVKREQDHPISFTDINGKTYIRRKVVDFPPKPTLRKFKVGLAVGGVMEHPEITYENIQIIEASDAEEARKIYNEINNCNFYYGEVLEELW